MKKAGLFFAFIMIMALSLPALAQEPGTAAAEPTDQEEANWRSFEVATYGGLMLPSGALKTWNDSMGAKTGVNFGASSALYFNEKLCLGAYFTYHQNPMKLYNLHYKLYDLGLYAKYAFAGESDFEPYVKVSGGAVFAKYPTWVGDAKARLREVSYSPVFGAGFHAGLLYYTSEYGGLFLEGSYHMVMLKDVSGDHSGVKYYLKDNIHYLELNAGIMVFFGSEK